jgi:hypothetical protein
MLKGLWPSKLFLVNKKPLPSWKHNAVGLKEAKKAMVKEAKLLKNKFFSN